MSLNKVMLIGNVGKEPEVRYLEPNVASATLSLATNTPGYTLPNGTTVPERTEWHRVLFWRGAAQYVERYVHTGDKIYVEGQLRTRSYTDKQGKTRYVTEIWADNLELLSSKNSRPQQEDHSSTASDENAPMGQSNTTQDKCPF